MVKVVIKNLSKSFGKFVAVDDLSLEVEQGKMTAFLGPSGCGKTTTLRLLAGLEAPSGGEIYFDDTLVNELPTEKRDVAMVFQFYAIYPDMSVYENIAFPLRMQKTPKEEVEKRVKEAAEKVRISHILGAKEMTITIGEKQRVALARAVVRNPKLYLFDEPLTNLDARLRGIMRTELRKLHLDLGQTSIYVTHDQLEAMTMADKIAVMNEGKLIQYDVPDVLFNKPRTIFTAGFIGTPPMNLLDCSLVEKNGGSYLDFGEFKIDSPEVSGKADLLTTELVAGIRPSDIEVEMGDSKAKGDLSAEAYSIEDLGDMQLVELKIGSAVVQALVPLDKSISPGDKLHAHVNSAKLHLFSRATGEAVQ